MTKIKPITLPFNKGTANEIYIRPINIEFYKDTCDSYWELLEVTETIEIVDGKEVVNVSKKVIQRGNMTIPSEIYLNWDDDKPMIDYVINALGLERL